MSRPKSNFGLAKDYGIVFEALAPLVMRVWWPILDCCDVSIAATRRTTLLMQSNWPTFENRRGSRSPYARARYAAWREAITYRRKLAEKRTRAKNGTRDLLRQFGVTHRS